LEANEYDVEDIIGHKWLKIGHKQEMRYLVRWEGYGPQYNTWEPPVNVKNTGQLIAEYQRKHRL
jgi:hypothetical protein